MDKLILYIHGQGGSADEALHYQPLFPDCDVIGLDYAAQTPWEAMDEFPRLFDALAGRYRSVSVIANSIGAFFAMLALAEKPIARAFFISPVVDMALLITNMMGWAQVTEDDLRARGEIVTDFGQTLSWRYLTFVREHPLRWTIPTRILFGSEDHLMPRETVAAFAGRLGAQLTVMEGGEHWFHTEEQMRFLDSWITAAD